jgi:uncharacterized protein YaiI (UPF0178 family)
MRMKLLIDGDSCPRDIRAILIRAGVKRGIDTRFYADRKLPDVIEAGLTMVVVEAGDDAADNALYRDCGETDLCVTRDMLLADKLVGRGALVIDSDGTLYTRENIRERVSMRNAMMELRFGGVTLGGKKPGKAELMRFANTFDRILQKRIKEIEEVQ